MAALGLENTFSCLIAFIVGFESDGLSLTVSIFSCLSGFALLGVTCLSLILANSFSTSSTTRSSVEDFCFREVHALGLGFTGGGCVVVAVVVPCSFLSEIS